MLLPNPMVLALFDIMPRVEKKDDSIHFSATDTDNHGLPEEQVFASASLGTVVASGSSLPKLSQATSLDAARIS
jgi:hypothetical protein